MFITQKITSMVYCSTSLKLLTLATELSGLGGGVKLKTIEKTEKIKLYCNAMKIL